MQSESMEFIQMHCPGGWWAISLDTPIKNPSFRPVDQFFGAYLLL